MGCFFFCLVGFGGIFSVFVRYSSKVIQNIQRFSVEVIVRAANLSSYIEKLRPSSSSKMNLVRTDLVKFSCQMSKKVHDSWLNIIVVKVCGQ